MANKVAGRSEGGWIGHELASITKELGWSIADQSKSAKDTFLPRILESKWLDRRLIHTLTVP
jgi:hypothetical protein